jgi:hypothetical protein
MLLPALTGAPLAAGLHPVIAYNVLFLSGFALSALTTTCWPCDYWLCAGGVRGMPIYGFYPYRFEHYSHLELQMTYWMPLGLLAVHRFCEGLQLRYAIALAIFGVAELYSSMYYGVFFPLYVVAVMGALLVMARAPWRRVIGPLAGRRDRPRARRNPLARLLLAAQPAKGERTCRR